ncbi:MAG: YhjD/YihY/BrkB family envelope integrity protein [Pseudomonadota bacterium]
MLKRLKTHWSGRYLFLPVWAALVRLAKPDVRIVTGGISFYMLFSIFPLIYLILTATFLALPADVGGQLAAAINGIIATNVMPIGSSEISAVTAQTPRNLTFSVSAALLLVLWAAMSGTKALITGLRMIAHAEGQSSLLHFQTLAFGMTAALILATWLLGGAQIILTIVRNQEGGFALEFAREIAVMASTIWVTKWIAVFAMFYLILAISLGAQLSRGTPMLAGTAAGAACWLGVTFLFQLYLKYSTLDTIYGALASLIVGLVWLTVSVNTLLLAAALAVQWDDLSQDREPHLD